MTFTDFKGVMGSKLRNLVKVIRVIKCASKNRRREYTRPFRAGSARAAGAVPSVPRRSNATDAHLSATTAQGQINTPIYFFQNIHDFFFPFNKDW